MPPTPVTSATPYCDGATFIIYYDWRPFAQLLSDEDTPLADASTVAGDATLAKLLLAASGTVEVACFRGGMYAPEDLAALTGAAQAKLQKLVADLTAEEAYRRRAVQGIPPLPQFQESAALLQELEDGGKIWPLQLTIDAGNLDDEVEDSSRVEARALSTYRARELFGRRNNRIDPGT